MHLIEIRSVKKKRKEVIFITIVIILIVILIIGFLLYRKFRKRKKNTLLGYSGTNGGGKTFNMTNDVCALYKVALKHWKKANRKILPSKKYKEYKGLNKPQIYSNYPIEYKKGSFSLPITNAIMFEEETIPLGSQVVIDEFSSWISQFDFNEEYSETLNDHIQKWRHYHGNDSHFICCDQNSSNIPLQVRRRLNEVIVCQKTRHYWFVHITDYKCVQLCEDIKSMELIDKDNSDTDDKTLKMIRISFRKKYDDRAFSNRYTYVDDNNLNYKYVDSPLKVDLTLTKPKTKNKKYVILDLIIKNKKGERSEKQTKEEKTPLQ